MSITKEVSSSVINLINKGRSVEDITTLLFMNEEYDTKAKCRAVVTEVLETNDLVPTKKVPMSQQLKEWFHSQPDPLKVTKKQLEKAINDIGMSGGSIQWYIRVYMEAIDVATTVIKSQSK